MKKIIVKMSAKEIPHPLPPPPPKKKKRCEGDQKPSVLRHHELCDIAANAPLTELHAVRWL